CRPCRIAAPACLIVPYHRVHHGSDPLYLDRNYAGILIVWDRIKSTRYDGRDVAERLG
ncbi:MAG: hypothetical protein QOG28_3583, partial [Trebonia sp.]|nr:hypothetical protein [Trebonia sp.]